jgi:hypothetical protein
VEVEGRGKWEVEGVSGDVERIGWNREVGCGCG